ncbi:MAG: sensor histidine kinase [Limnohabitans sp.]|nr:sensor histidine kinase [Limnohabitans sp.]
MNFRIFKLLLIIMCCLFVNHKSYSQLNTVVSDKDKYISIIDSLRTNKIFDQKHINKVEGFYKDGNLDLKTIEKIKFNNYLAYYNIQKLDYKKSKDFCEKNLNYKVVSNLEKKELGYSYYYLGSIYLNQGEQKKSIEHILKALKIFEEFKNFDGIGRCKMLMAYISFNLKNYTDAEKIVNEALKVMPIKNNLYYMLILTKIKVLRQHNQKEEKKLLIKTYNELKQNNKIDKEFTIDNNAFLIELYIKEKDFNNARKIISETKSVIGSINSQRALDTFNWIICDYDLATNKPLSNEQYLIKRVKESKESNDLQTLTNLYEYLREGENIKGNSKKIYEYSKSYDSIIQIRANEETKNEILELKTKYELEKKEQQLKVKELLLDKKNKLILILTLATIGIIVLSLLSFILFKYKNDKKEKMLITDFTHQLFENIEEERKKFSFELHDELNHELLVLKRTLNLESSSKIDSIINDVRDISKNLHPMTFEKIGLKESLTTLISELENKNNFVISYDIEYDNSLSKQQEIQIFRIIQECLTNTIKHANAHAAKLSIIETEKSVQIEVKDNGTGFNVTEKLNNGKSFGLSSIIERCKAIKADYRINSSNQGTSINIEINK